MASGYRAGDALDERVRGAVRARVGITIKAEEVLAGGERVRDTWRVLGWRSTITDEAGMRARRLWLRGTGTGRVALSLTFARAGQPLSSLYETGTDVAAEFAFYPDGHRVVPVGDVDTGTAPPPEGGTVAEALDSFAAAVAQDPWRDAWPVVLDRAAPAHDGRWYLTDPDGTALPLTTPRPWRLLAVTGGAPATVAAALKDLKNLH